jgi:hypothetical protein
MNLIGSLALIALFIVIMVVRAAWRARRPPEDELVSDFRKRLESLHGTGPFADHSQEKHSPR